MGISEDTLVWLKDSSGVQAIPARLFECMFNENDCNSEIKIEGIEVMGLYGFTKLRGIYRKRCNGDKVVTIRYSGARASVGGVSIKVDSEQSVYVADTSDRTFKVLKASELKSGYKLLKPNIFNNVREARNNTDEMIVSTYSRKEIRKSLYNFRTGDGTLYAGGIVVQVLK